MNTGGGGVLLSPESLVLLIKNKNKKLIDFNWKDYNKLPVELTTVVGDYINIINMTFI